MNFDCCVPTSVLQAKAGASPILADGKVVRKKILDAIVHNLIGLNCIGHSEDNNGYWKRTASGMGPGFQD